VPSTHYIFISKEILNEKKKKIKKIKKKQKKTKKKKTNKKQQPPPLQQPPFIHTISASASASGKLEPCPLFTLRSI